MMLQSMGFSEFGAKRAALGSGNKGVAEAQEWAFKHMEDKDFNTDPDAPAPAAPAAAAVAPAVAPAIAAAPDPALLASLTSMGFSENAARRAARASSDAEARGSLVVLG